MTLSEAMRRGLNVVRKPWVFQDDRLEPARHDLDGKPCYGAWATLRTGCRSYGGPWALHHALRPEGGECTFRGPEQK